ncbi:TIGR03618 family F420-dependent PPOX class oxidoreductase [Mycolicibacterium goodii]|uniref:TIGR03618 family F420-dependent PPOX class oxidoreductase n=1 Tax=Mycolicibacterium goodii TaxID=134601 RepID=UPI0009FABDD1
MVAIPGEARHLFQGRDIAHLATLNADGSPQVSAVWVDLDGDLIAVNTTEGLVKTKNMRANPRVRISIVAQSNPYESLQIQGHVVEVTTRGADEGIDDLARRYLGTDGFAHRLPDDRRVIVKIAPSKVHHRNVPNLSTSAVLQLHQDQLRHLLNKDMDAWVDTFAQDAVFELPFAPSGYPQRLVGKAAIREYVKDYAKHIDLQRFYDVVIHPGHESETLVVEAAVEGRVLATNQPYRVRYVWVYTEANGKIIRQRDYWNPAAVVDALGGDAAMRNAFNVTP